MGWGGGGGGGGAELVGKVNRNQWKLVRTMGMTGRLTVLFAASFRDNSAEKDGCDVTTTPLSESQHYLGRDSLVISKGSLGE